MLKHIISTSAVLAALLASTNAGAIVGGHAADPGEFPWTAAIYRTDSSRGLLSGQFCGGSLVAPTVVVTAKHCVAGLLQRVDNVVGGLPFDQVPYSLGVLVGENHLNGSGGERIRVARVSAHSDPETDIAVLVLRKASTVTPLPFASPDDEAFYSPGTMATVTGWGATRERGPVSNELLEAQVPVISDEACATKYDNGLVARTMICAGYDEGGTDTCQGDSGGPIVVPRGSGWLLIGTTWWGEGCAREGKPGVYSEVAPAWDYINSFVNAAA